MSDFEFSPLPVDPEVQPSETQPPEIDQTAIFRPIPPDEQMVSQQPDGRVVRTRRPSWHTGLTKDQRERVERNVVYMAQCGIPRLRIQEQHDMSNTAVMTILKKYEGRHFDKDGNEIITLAEKSGDDLLVKTETDIFNPDQAQEQVEKEIVEADKTIQLEHFRGATQIALDTMIEELGDPSEVARTTAELAMTKAREALANQPHDMDVVKKVSEIISRCQNVIRETSHLEKMSVDEVVALWNS